MYSTLATTADTDALDENAFLFKKSQNDVLSISVSDENAHMKAPGPNMVPISGLDKLMYEPYNGTTPASTHHGDIRDSTETNGSHMGGRDGPGGAMSNGYVNGQDISYALSPLHHPPSLQSLRPALHPNSLNSNTLTTSTEYHSPYPSAKATPGSSASTALPHTSKEATHNSEFTSGDSRLHGRLNPFPTPETALSTSSSDYRRATSKPIRGKVVEFRANSSIPQEMSWEEFARQCILAAESSRLNPFALHPEEYKLLRSHVNHAQVTIYLNIRNAILRLWTRSPLVKVTLEEAAGCARDKRYFNLAEVAYLWLLRNGYINFGCVDVANTKETNMSPRKAKAALQRTILVIGAGMSGLGCARQLESLSLQLENQWTQQGEQPPKIIVLEARPRIGGRVYSHPFHNQTNSTLPAGHRCTAEMGAQIVTGFEHGNPLNVLIRGQLGIPYHILRDNTILYDHDGTIVEKRRDQLVENLYNDVLERASVYRSKPAVSRTVEGDRKLIQSGRDPNDVGGPTVAKLEMSNSPPPADATTTASTTAEKPSTGVEKLAGRAYQLAAGFDPYVPAAKAVQGMGWRLKAGASTTQLLELDPITKSSKWPTLGETMDEGIMQYQTLIDMTPRDLRLLNWHHANLEYANAVNVNQLSLSGWDQDIGNEFEGWHTEVIGGYQQVPRGLWQCPTKLDVRFKSPVKWIHYDVNERSIGKPVKVQCHNGEVFEADQVVLTTPLGVLKSGSITFNPPLPTWKQDVIERMGFGLLNKVVLVYEEAFWEPHRDMFGLLNEAERQASLDVKDYKARRGRFYLFWNCIKTSGKPTLIALMAGDAAHHAEATPDHVLVADVTGRLAKMFAPKHVPLPSETIVTRWSKDPYARGSYSYVGPQTLAGDYNVMAKPHGPLHFAGEATCGTHPATVHGAYLSGLRAAAEVVETMIGPIKVPSPIIGTQRKQPETARSSPAVQAIKKEPKPAPKPHYTLEPVISQPPEPPPTSRDRPTQHDEDYEASIIGAILSEIGVRPIKPGRNGATNPFLLFTKDYWYPCKKECDEAKQAAGDRNAKASRTEIRSAVGLKWRTASAEDRKPYVDQAEAAKKEAVANEEGFEERVATWDREAARIRKEYIQNHPPADGNSDALLNGRTAIEVGASKRARRI